MRDKITIGMAARITSDKYQVLLLDTIIKNKDYFREKKIFLRFAGDGDMLSKLRYKVKKHNISDLINFDGYLQEKKLISWFRKMDIYVHLSKDETTSTSILQAMSMSLPIIASNIGGNRNFLKYYNGQPNIILTKNSLDDIFKKLKNLITNKLKRKKMSKYSRQTILKFYSSKMMFRKYEKLF